MSESLPHNASRIKRALIEAGFEVFRTRSEEIVLAERPRENLIMDSGVRLRLAASLEVRVVLRAQKADFPNEEEARIFERVRKLADHALAAGFAEVSTSVTRVADPGRLRADARHVLRDHVREARRRAARRAGRAQVRAGLEKRAE